MVSKSKTLAGTGRLIPLNPRALAVLTHWHGLFSGVQPEHYIFPQEKYGLAGNDRKPCAWEIEPSEPNAPLESGLGCRQTPCKRLLPLSRSPSHVQDTLSGADFEPGVAQNWAHFFVSEKPD